MSNTRSCARCIRLAVALLVPTSASQAQGADQIPRIVDVGEVRIEIVDALFVTEMRGIRRRYNASNPDELRGLVLTLRIEKPVGEFRLSAPDLALHYTYGDEDDVNPCNGLSSFSTTADVDRPMRLFPRGYGSSVTTGTATVRAEVIYVDAFIQGMEPATEHLHLLLAQPIGAYFRTDGYGAKPGGQ